MRQILFFLLLVSFSSKAQVAQHCGYDFTSYFVVNAHESGHKNTIKGLKIKVVNAFGLDVLNVNNFYSWTDNNKSLNFTENYKIDDKGNKISGNDAVEKERWFFPFAKDSYLLSIKSTFPADDFFIKIEDVDGAENGGDFKTQTIKLYPFNMYVLCSSKARETQFGPKMNRPIDVVLERK